MATFFNLKKENQTDFKLPFARETAGLQADVYKAEPTDDSGIVSVIKNLRFTGSDLTDYTLNRIPFCLLKEYELRTNSSINSLLYILQGSGYSSADVVSGITNLGGILKSNTPSGVAGATTDVAGAITEGSTALGINDFISKGAQVLKDGVTDIVDLLKAKEVLPGSLKPYQGLYIRQPTGFKYILPYFKNVKKGISNSFSTTDSGMLAGNWVGSLSKKVSDKVDEFVKTALFTSPGAYIEQPKFFNIGEEGPTYEVTFHLINTINKDDVQKHYDFLFLLAFQNLPYRKDLARLRLPCIYSFTLPGEIFLPYAYIKSMTVDFVGNRRILNSLRHPLNNSIMTPGTTVPDVYEVTLTITGLNADMGNFMVNDYLVNINSTLASDLPQDRAQSPININPPGAPRPLITPDTPPAPPNAPIRPFTPFNPSGPPLA